MVRWKGERNTPSVPMKKGKDERKSQSTASMFRGGGFEVGGRLRHKMDNNVYNRVVEHVMSVTDEEFADLSVAVLAYSLKINRFKLSRQFKSQSDMTVEEFLFKEKMARAAFLLKTFEDITVKEVSRRIGFCTCDYFIRKFKQYYGVAPGRYKEFKPPRPLIGDQAPGQGQMAKPERRNGYKRNKKIKYWKTRRKCHVKNVISDWLFSTPGD
jgi:AraC-like DNA-binding protein